MRLVRDEDEMEFEEASAQEPTEFDRGGSELPDGPLDQTEAAEENGSEPEKAVDLGLLEALLLTTHHPLTPAKLAELLDVRSVKSIRKGVGELNEQYKDSGRAFSIEQVAGGYQILTLPQYAPALKALYRKEIDAKLTKAAMETLAIIAYKQPILRADVEAIRGVACGETIRSLMEKHLVRIAGRAEEPGRPILYGTTKRFLELFGLNSLKDLPQPEMADKSQTA
jgi:segregation and condensation protein B